MARTALIVGAGIGGLSAGLALQRAGWGVRIFERADSARALGFGLALATNAMEALGELGIAEVVRASAFEPRCGEVRRPNGSVLKRGALSPDVQGPLVITLRPALHAALLQSLDAAVLTLGYPASGFVDARDRVRLQLEDGRAVEGDLVIGADGVHSVIRQTLHPHEPAPRRSGLVAVRGVVHEAHHHLGELSAVLYLGRGVEAMLGRAGGTSIYWYLSLAHQLIPSAMRDPAAILARLSPHFDDTFRGVTSATTEMRYDELLDRDPLPSWGTGRVTLLGDAAHPLLPQTGQGAAQAMVDAVTLARALAHEENIEHALRVYERERLESTARWVRQGRRAAWLMGTMNPVVCALRDGLIRLTPVSLLAAAYARAKSDART